MRKKRVRQIQMGFSLLMALVLLGGCSEIEAGVQTSTKVEEVEEVKPPDEETLRIYYLDVGQGDATLITSNGEAMLVDAGDNAQGAEVCSYLEYLGITSLEAIVATHPDADHIGGMDDVLEKFSCEKFFLSDCTNDTKTYEEMMELVGATCEAVYPEVGSTFSLGGSEICFLGPVEEAEDTNDMSLSFRLTYENTSFLFVGDASEGEMESILEEGADVSCDVYKVSHHGSKTAAHEAFLSAANPSYGIISCGEGNKYGHPHAAVLHLLRSMGVDVFRTDEQGTIVAESDGEEITFSAAPTDSWQQGEAQGSAQGSSGEETEEEYFILNKNTGKFHLPDCSSVKKMSERNKETVTSEKEALMEEGYSPCKNCIGEGL